MWNDPFAVVPIGGRVLSLYASWRSWGLPVALRWGRAEDGLLSSLYMEIGPLGLHVTDGKERKMARAAAWEAIRPRLASSVSNGGAI